ncbi:MAG: nucleoside-triphosphatase [Cellulosilyticaceae bacterium]
MVYRNIFVTGEKGVGKSTIVAQVIEKLGMGSVGFRTLPYEIEGDRRGFYLSGLVEVGKYKNNTPISVMVGSERCVGITETFETLGVEVLAKSLVCEEVILMDELGKLERHAEVFQDMVLRCLESERVVFGVLKQCESTFIQGIMQRADTKVFEVTKKNRELIIAEIMASLGIKNT